MRPTPTYRQCRKEILRAPMVDEMRRSLGKDGMEFPRNRVASRSRGLMGASKSKEVYAQRPRSAEALSS
ncbi:hypothetical protein A0H81_08183 [Grifola frondosa]|uniref:Uncharacterized protein n=1 Tax=Grifola frondosa TaxID=5627 RepID=A0A1C7M5Z3_GRIFR|nr:hypothetical protein A0H81_08183 [Grifola frondosa]